MSTNITVDISYFYPHNIIDSCSISNILSSGRFYSAAITAGCKFYCTSFVLYECLYKQPKKEKPALLEFRGRFKEAIQQGNFKKYDITIEDLQEIDVLHKRQKLSKGELSSMVFAKKTGQAFLTDDRKARILAGEYIDPRMVQTIPHLFGWLYFISMLSDGDKADIIMEHTRMERPLSKYFEMMYLEALKLRLASSS